MNGNLRLENNYMRTYKEHYNYCKGLYNIKSEKYNTLYDLRVDNSFLNEVIDTKYYSLIETIRTKIDEKIKSNKGVFQDKHAIRVNDWYDIKELEDLVKILCL